MGDNYPTEAEQLINHCTNVKFLFKTLRFLVICSSATNDPTMKMSHLIQGIVSLIKEFCLKQSDDWIRRDVTT
jgi:hypothetical protein